MREKGDTHPLERRAFGIGWNGVKWRYRAMTECDSEFRKSIESYGPAPIIEERYKQEKSLYDFFTNLVSTLENLFFSLYCIASTIKSNEFPISDVKSLRLIFPESVESRFKQNFPSDKVTDAMSAVISDAQYIQTKDFRDFLCHRGPLPRAHNVGGDDDGKTHLPSNPKDPISTWLTDFELSVSVTYDKHEWLRNSVNLLFEASYDFVGKHL